MNNMLKITALAVAATLASSGAWAKCSPDFSGVEITATTQTGPYIASALQNAAEGWGGQDLRHSEESLSFRGRSCIQRSSPRCHPETMHSM